MSKNKFNKYKLKEGSRDSNANNKISVEKGPTTQRVHLTRTTSVAIMEATPASVLAST